MNFQIPDIIKENAWQIIGTVIMSGSAVVGSIYASGLQEGMAITKQEAVAIREGQAKTGAEISEVRDDVNTVKQDVAEMKGKVSTIIELLKRQK